MSLIALSGYSNSGKDLVGQYIQLLNSPKNIQNRTDIERISDRDDWWLEEQSYWEIKKFAGKLKEIASILTGIAKHKFEDQEFKKTTLSSAWDAPIPGEDWHDGKPVLASMTVREFLQKLGTDGLRDGLHTNVWVNALFADYQCTHTDHAPNGLDCSNWVITDCRFPNEAQAVKDHGGIVIRINRPGITAVNAHPSETSLDNWNFDAVINNDGSKTDLYNQVKSHLEKHNLCYP